MEIFIDINRIGDMIETGKEEYVASDGEVRTKILSDADIKALKTLQKINYLSLPLVDQNLRAERRKMVSAFKKQKDVNNYLREALKGDWTEEDNKYFFKAFANSINSGSPFERADIRNVIKAAVQNTGKPITERMYNQILNKIANMRRDNLDDVERALRLLDRMNYLQELSEKEKEDSKEEVKKKKRN